MSYHDAYWRPEDGSWNKTDPAELLKRLYRRSSRVAWWSCRITSRAGR